MRNIRALCAAWMLSTFSLCGALVSSFQAGDSGWHLGTIAVGNLDGSPDQEIVIPYRDSSGNWFLDAFKYNGQRLPGFPYASGSEEINTSPTLCDLDHDGRNEILFTRGNHVIALRGNGSVLWSNTVDSSNYVPDGGYQTVTGGFYWFPTGTWLSHLPSSAVFSSPVSPPMVVDLNGTGSYEVITAWKIRPDPSGAGQDYNPFIFPIYGFGQWGTIGENWSGGVVTFDAATGRQNFVYHLHHLVESGLAVGRMKRSGPLHIAELNDSDSVVCFDKSQPFGLWGKGMLHGQFGKSQRLMTGSYLFPIDIYTADLDGDGLDEVLVAGTQLSPLWQPNETILDNDGGILWRRWLPHLDIANANGWLNSASLIPCNPDHDNHVDVLGFNHSYEITFRYWNGAELVDRPGWPKNFYPALPCPPVVGDVDGDGKEEIIIGTYNPTQSPSTGNLFIYALDGTLKQSVAVPGGLKHVPALADVEGNGKLDVVYRSLSGRVYVQNFGSTATNLVSWATHRGNMRRDGNRGVSLYPPGTPVVTSRVPGYNRASFTWSNSTPPDLYRVYRAERAAGPFLQVATFTGSINSHTDFALKPGREYFYEVAAIYGSNSVHSAPFTVLALFNNNLVANSGFERNDNCRWDKWFTGDIDMTNMSVSTSAAYQGDRSMCVRLQNQAANGSIAQYNQYGIPDSTIYTTPGAFYSFGCWFKSDGLSAPSEHWLEWSSTKTGYDTNNRPALPDPLYYTPHFAPGTGTSVWTYVNRTFQLPAGFPNLELCHRYTVSSPVSGSIYLDNVFLRQLPAPSATNWQNLVSFGSQWRYQTNTPPPGWVGPAFNDASWPLGTAKFGNGSGPTNIATRLPQGLSSYYFRKKFVAPSTDFEELLLAATCTDVSATALYPPRIFLNGTEVKTCVDVSSLQGNATRYLDLTPFIELIRPGTNVIAVLLANTWSDYDDVAFDLSLKAVAFHPVSPRLSLACASSSNPSLSVETPAGSVWRIESTDSLGAKGWELMQTFTNTTGGLQTFSDTGQNSRLLPGSVDARLYRLVPF